MEDETLQLVRPSPERLDDYRDACRETWGHVHDNYILHDPARFDEWKTRIFDDYRAQEAGIGLPDGHVPSATFWLVRGNRYIGTVNIRLRLNEGLARYGGHAGVVIRLSERGKGYGTAALPLALRKARELGIADILLTCTEDNAPSLATLRSLPCKREEHDRVPVGGILKPVVRFFF